VVKTAERMNAFENIIKSVQEKQSFILEAGAGSGKTHTLIQTVNYLLDNHSDDLNEKGQKIACITFTNVAKDQIIERTGGNELVLAKTIHEFLWESIANFQMQLHPKLEELNKYYNDNRKSYEYIENLEKEIKNKNITYWDYGRRLLEGKITHEDVLLLSNFMFRDFQKLSQILADKYPFLFVDEYQDTELETIELLIDFHLLRNNSKLILGFFGDSMQKIYPKGIGKIPHKYINDNTLNFITKEENFRSSIKVVNLLNKIRTNLTQKPQTEKQGRVSFIYNCTDFENGLSYINENKLLDVNNDYKSLFLTHRTIAKKNGFESLYQVYSNRYKMYANQRLFEKDDRYSDFFMGDRGVEKLLEFYQQKNYSEFINLLGKTGFKLRYHVDKIKIRTEIDELIKIREEGTVIQVLEFLKETSLITISDRIIDFENKINSEESEQAEDFERNSSFHKELMITSYKEWLKVYSYVQSDTPFSTKHNTKGDEYENVLMVIDDDAWKNQYNFDKMISNTDTSENRQERSLNLFYVCCSRAKENLVVLVLSQISAATKQKAKEWFSVENVYEL
jgi:DNA helicase II / ATP-dependent DNA helicase PcrA